jgi:platelet-activating factor acetylhydrolase IB subunit alpha
VRTSGGFCAGAIAEYLRGNGFEDLGHALAQATGIALAAPGGAGDSVLEKKWTAVVRLQKRAMELETQVKQLEEELKSAQPGAVRRKADGGRQLPRAPHARQFARHRSPVSRVIFHPVFPLLVTCSEDASVIVWDYESGEFERTLKGHTGSINDVAFNGAGTALATCSADLNVKLWDFESTYECSKTLKGHVHKISKVLSTVTSYGEYTTALTFKKFCRSITCLASPGCRATSSSCRRRGTCPPKCGRHAGTNSEKSHYSYLYAGH